MVLAVEGFRKVNHCCQDCSAFREVLIEEDEGDEVDQIVVD